MAKQQIREGLIMKYSDIQAKHNLTDEQMAYVDALCQQYAVEITVIDDWTINMTVVGMEFKGPFVHIRHSDIVLHVDLFNAGSDSLGGKSWALAPEGVKFLRPLDAALVPRAE